MQEMDFSTAGYIQLALLDRMAKDGVDVSDFKFVNVEKNRYKIVNRTKNLRFIIPYLFPAVNPLQKIVV
ncbi:MAG: hypothetical protein LIO53_03670 [Oscillospiraceae bacterium]|nr:hypothetical protein [Oscillospiraceae bacterium]